jgi:N6-L-threonylcarbamoyladenine synthase
LHEEIFKMLILGIESSCDETGAALVRDGRSICSNVVASQIEIHNRYGGVVPEVASRQQLAAILPVIETALEQASCTWDDIDAVAATYGPGLAGSLLVGLTVGKTLSLAFDRPFLGVNHLEAHIYANWLHPPPSVPLPVGTAPCACPESGENLYCEGDPLFPLLCLVVSGAHSELVLVRDHGQYELLGRTRDDAAGEAFDKVARILGLDYPGGPSIQKAAQQAELALVQQQRPVSQARNAYRLPRAWLRGTYDFSFSGLKTAMLHLAEGVASVGADRGKLYPGGEEGLGEGLAPSLGDKAQVSHPTRYTRMGAQASQTGTSNVALLAAGFQEAVVDVLAVKTRLAAEEYQVKQVLLAGGVAANLRLRERLTQELQPRNIRLSYPAVAFCTDNAAMIASVAFFHLSRGERHEVDLDVEPGLSLPFRR